MKLGIITLTLAATLFIGVQSSYACSCIRQTTCQYSSTATAAFAGKVLDSTELTRKVTRRQLPMGGEWEEREYEEERQVSRIAVQESFFGTGGSEEMVIETEIGSSCGFRLQAGETYLIYASRNDKEVNLMTHMCSGTRTLSAAADDIAYLRANKDKAATLLGKVGFGSWGRLDPKPLARHGVNTVRLTGGEKPLDAEIAPDGSYSFPNLAPGIYNISVVLPDFLTVSEKYHPDIAEELEIGDQTQMKVGEHGCVSEDFLLLENGRISGRVTDAKGDPVEDITVYLIPVDSRGRKIPQDEPCYDTKLCLDAREDGRFFFKGLKAGRYLVGVRMGDYVCNDCVDAEFKKALFPGVTDERMAKPVTVKFGVSTSDVNFKVVGKYASQEIEGRVVFPGGRPAANVSVRYAARTPDLKDSGLTFIKTDNAGYFSFTGYESHDYLIGAFTDERDKNEPAEAKAVEVRVQAGRKPGSITLILDQVDGRDNYHDFPKKRVVTKRSR